MADELTLAELKERAKVIGYTNIQRQGVTAQILALAKWKGVSSETGSFYTLIGVWYILDGNKVTVLKAGEPDIYYVLS